MTREEAIAYFKDMNECTYGSVEPIQMAIQALEQEPKTGHWVHFATSDDCSECGWSTGKYISPSNYCPNCGARMVEPQEGSE